MHLVIQAEVDLTDLTCVIMATLCDNIRTSDTTFARKTDFETPSQLEASTMSPSSNHSRHTGRSLLGLPSWNTVDAKNDFTPELSAQSDTFNTFAPAIMVPTCNGVTDQPTAFSELCDRGRPLHIQPSTDVQITNFEEKGEPLTIGSGESVNDAYNLRFAPRLADYESYECWPDQDFTGDYDPANNFDPGLQAPFDIYYRKRERPFHLVRHDSDKPKIPKVNTWQQGRHHGDRLPVTLKFESVRAIAAMRSFGSSLDNWPKSAYISSSQESDLEDLVQSEASCTGHVSSSYELRDRKQRRTLHYHTYSTEDKHLALENVTLGHPAARGCKGCFHLQQRCPLLDEGSRYPCDICVEDEVDCELVLESPKKGPCLTCSGKRIVCSYRDQKSDHSIPCSYCATRRLRCIAGPASGRTRLGPCLDAVSPSKSLFCQDVAKYVKPFSACTGCLKSKIRCSHSTQGTAKDGRPCVRCRKDNTQCTFEPRNRVKVQQHNQNVLSRELPPALPNTTRISHKKGEIQIIKTKIAYPLYFSYSGDEPCQWCQDPFYGLLGLGEKEEVEVIDFDGEGYVELSGGHAEDGHPPSRMCDECTLDRLIIAACRFHEIEMIADIDPDTFDHDAALEFLAPGKAASAPFSWCSVCPAPALFTCCSERADLDLEDEEVKEKDEDRPRGCGLHLCQACAVTLVKEKAGKLGSLVESLKMEDDPGGFGLRADVEFLLPEGELLRRMSGV